MIYFNRSLRMNIHFLDKMKLNFIILIKFITQNFTENMHKIASIITQSISEIKRTSQCFGQGGMH